MKRFYLQRKRCLLLCLMLSIVILQQVKAESYVVDYDKSTETTLVINCQIDNQTIFFGKYNIVKYYHWDDGDEIKTYIGKKTIWNGVGTLEIPMKNSWMYDVTNTLILDVYVWGTPYPQYINFKPLPLVDVTDLTASDNRLDTVRLNWEKGTAYADSEIEYEIKAMYETSNSYLTVSGDARCCDFPIDPSRRGEDVQFSVTTKLINDPFDGPFREANESEGVYATGRTFDFELKASTDKTSEVELSWTKSEFMNGYYLYIDGSFDRSLPDNIESCKVSPSKNGYYHQYTICSSENEGYSSSAYGRTKPNGRIEGTVKTSGKAVHVGGVIIKAERIIERETDSLQYGFEIATEYTAVSSQKNGKYTIDGIYYDHENGSEFIVTPIYLDHNFKPDTIYTELLADYPSDLTVNFTDTTALSVTGTINNRFGCPVQGVAVMVEGEGMPDTTKTDGTFSLTVSNPGIYSIVANKKGHDFEEQYAEIEILKDTSNINFTDTETTVVNGCFSASCQTNIGTAELRFYNEEGCYDSTIVVDSSYYAIELPTNSYKVELLSFESLNNDVDFEDDVMDFFKETQSLNLDSLISDSVTVAVDDSIDLNFTYRLTPTLNYSFVENVQLCDDIIMEQGKTYHVAFNIVEAFMDKVCNADTGFLVIEEYLTTDDVVEDTVYFGSEVDTLEFTMAVPNIYDPYTNKLRMKAVVGSQETEWVEEQIIIVGHKPNTSTFTTVAPNVPLLVLHDPPGDGSYSHFEETTSFHHSHSISTNRSLSGGVNVGIKMGVAMLKGQFVFSETKATTKISNKTTVTVSAGIDTTWDIETRMEKGYTTADDDNIIGEDGDIYIGGAMNLKYAITKVLEYDTANCKVREPYNTIALEPNGFATTYMYTESHITDYIIPNLIVLRDGSTDAEEKLSLDNEIDNWNQIIENNHKNIEDAVLVEDFPNISFSGGVRYSSSMTSSSSTTNTITGSLKFENVTETETEIEESGTGTTVDFTLGVEMEVGATHSWGSGTETTTGFELYDDDLGDFQSVYIYKDQAYGTPVFKVEAGTTSCPWESGTQPREGVRLRADKMSQVVSAGENEAVFKLQLANTSESDEDNTYELVFDATSNPDGATVYIGGSTVSGGEIIPYNIAAGQSVQATVVVEKVNDVNIYENLRFVLQSECDGAITDEVLLDVEFEEGCGEIDLQSNMITPVVNSNSGNKLQLTLSDYSASSISSVDIERLSPSSTIWETVKAIESFNLGISKTIFDLSFSSFEDSTYYIRAVANCENGKAYSDLLQVQVDRETPSISMVNPENGDSLVKGGTIYAIFDEEIMEISTNEISVYNQTQGVDIGYQHGQIYKKLIVMPNSDEVNDGDTLLVTVAEVNDLFGNSNPSCGSWKFAVTDVNKVFDNNSIDYDHDGVVDSLDNCPLAYNSTQDDLDGDGIGDVCDEDIDGDGITNDIDVCPYFFSTNQEDIDGDGIGDLCDDDIDGDLIVNEDDLCPTARNTDQADSDLDGIGDICDNCPDNANSDQADFNGNGVGDVCETTFMKENTSNSTFNVYPSLFKNYLIIQINDEEVKSRLIEIYDVTGKKIYENRILVSRQLQINTSDFKSGMYMVKVVTECNSSVKKVTKL